MEINNIFSDWLGEEKLNLNLEILQKHIYDFQKTDPEGVVFSNQNGWQSKPESVCHKENFDLFRQANFFAKEISKMLDLTQELKLLEYWYNINYHCSFNMAHTHIRSSNNIMTGVFYVKVPENSGNIIFQTADKLRQVSYDSNVKSYKPYTSSKFIQIPKENTLLFFPSSLEHFVEPNNNTQERISISFNYGYK